MPVFEYKCNNCKEKFDLLVFGQDTNVTCPKCGSENVQKLISAFASQGAADNSSHSCGGSGRFS